jgi:hypothetical protein
MTATQPAAITTFYRVTEFFHGDTLRFLALRCDAAGQHTGRVEGSLAREYHAEAMRDGEREGLPEWPNPWARMS